MLSFNDNDSGPELFIGFNSRSVLTLTGLGVEGQFNLATLCGEAKHYQCAVQHMKEYLELTPDSPDAQAAKDSIIIWKDKLSAFRAAIAQDSSSGQPGSNRSVASVR